MKTSVDMVLAPIFKKAYWSLAAFGLAYLAFVFALTHPVIQREALYVHRINPTRWQNLTEVESFGFLKHQVQQFNLTTSDGEVLHAWHILPLHLYHLHERELISQRDFGLKSTEDVVDTPNLRLLINDDNAIVVVNFHGNAGHLASGERPATYRQWLSLSTKERPIHVIAIDYRGFGLSTGKPTEDGLILDGMAVVSFLTGLGFPSQSRETTAQNAMISARHTYLGIDPTRIILVGQSLGTAVSTAVVSHWVQELHLPPFRGLFLIASFTSLPKLIDSYAIRGWIPPLLSPINGYPKVKAYIMSKILDTWRTDQRLASLVNKQNHEAVDITILHARDDLEIPWREGRGNWDSIVLGTEGEGGLVVQEGRAENGDHEVRVWRDESSERAPKRVRWERCKAGGHNQLAASEQAGLAMMRVLEKVYVTEQSGTDFLTP